tara:strand:- start:8119 stop:8742 length:624 start_codon:yes stop_codon:yes gene_type:complete
MKLFIALLMMGFELGFVHEADSLSIDLSALSTSQTRSIFASGKHLQEFYDGDLKTSQVEIAGKYARTEGREATYSSGIGSTFFFPIGMTVESDFRYYQSHTTFAGSAGFGYKVATVGLGPRIEFPDAGGRQTFLRAIGIIRGKTNVKGRELSVSLKGEALRGKNDAERADYWVDLRYRIGKHLNVGLRFEEIRHEKVQAAVLGINFL